MYAILDIETTGGAYNEESIIEIAIYKFNGHEVVDQFISLIHAERDIQPFVQKLTGINAKMLKTAPKFFQVAKRIVELTEDCVLVAHNAQFDYRILRTEFSRLGFDYKRKTICTIELAKKLIPDKKSYSLGKLARTLGIPVSNRHRANGDALATVALFKLLLAKDSGKRIIQKATKTTHFKSILSTKLLRIVENLPNTTGVYYIHKENGAIIYIGKSNNIKQAVNQHFIRTSKKAKQIQKEVASVTYEATGNELIALLKEHEEIKQNKPIYNHYKKQKISNGKLANENFIIIDKGRDHDERSAILIENGVFKGIGYYHLNHQINNIHILQSLITPMQQYTNTTTIIQKYLNEKKVLKIINF